MLVFGRLADLHGQKKVFLLSSIWLVAFTLGCAFAHDEITLNVLRGLQGVGAAAMLPAVIGILARSFPPSRARSVAFSAFAAGAPLGAAFGMVLGGVLIEFTRQRWRSIFYLLTALTFLTFVGGALTFEPDQPSTEQDKSVDWLGAFMVTVSLVLIVFALGQGEMADHQWATACSSKPCIVYGMTLNSIRT
jgi:MFS family permease